MSLADKLATVTAIPNVGLPAVPEEIVNMMVNYMEDRNIPLDQRIMILQSKFDIKETNDIWTEWVSNNIVKNFMRASIQKINKGDLVPHKDMVRNFSLLYLIKSGGERVTTSFYKLKPGLDEMSSRSVFRYSYLDELDTFQFKEGTWNLLNNKSIHAVKGIDQTRISLAIDFIQYPEFVDQFV